MTKDIDHGGAAFPIEGGPDCPLYPDPGMSLRDWFAGQALAGLMANKWFVSADDIFTRNGSPVLADAAYLVADAMVEARK